MQQSILKKISFFLIITSQLLITTLSRSQINVNCDTSKVGQSTNLGLYGGLTVDYAFSQTGRLFSASLVPASLFISDDTAKTWYKAFPADSLEFACGTRGWGGGGTNVYTNTKGWAAVLTKESANEAFSSAVISFNNGDTGSWHTAIDNYLLEQLGYEFEPLGVIALSDYYLYATTQKYIARVNGNNQIDTSNIIDITKRVSGIDSTTSKLAALAVANSVSGYPFYIVVDSVGSSLAAPKGKLYKYDGNNFSNITLPSILTGITKVFTHPYQITGDTIFISGRNKAQQLKTYRSYDGGNNWTLLTAPDPITIKDVEYSANWNLTNSNNIILIGDASNVSFDLGSTWNFQVNISFDPTKNVVRPYSQTLFPLDTSINIAGDKTGSFISTSGINGIYSQSLNKGFEAILIWDIDRNESESVFYLGTQSGLAYTTKYNDSLIAPTEKWVYPNGLYPVCNITESVYAIAIDPNDSLHIIAGTQKAFHVSSFGPDSFIAVMVGGYDEPGTVTQDIEFINSNIVISVTGAFGETYYKNGGIWRSENGGYSWTDVSPTNFGCGRTVAYGVNGSDTVLYVGTGLGSVEPGALWKSTDLGLTWVEVNTGPDGLNAPDLVINEIEVDPRGADTLYLIAGVDTNGVLAKSTDGGLTYQYLLSNSTVDFEQFYSIEIDPAYPDSIMYLSGERKLFQYNPLLDSLDVIYTGLPGERIYDIAIGSILVGTTTGFYGIEKTDEGIITSISPTNTNSPIAFFVYPNPVTNEAFIKIEGINGVAKELNITLYDVMGRIVKEMSYKNYAEDETIRFDASLLSNGIYYLQMNTGNTIVSQKVIKN